MFILLYTAHLGGCLMHWYTILLFLHFYIHGNINLEQQLDKLIME